VVLVVVAVPVVVAAPAVGVGLAVGAAPAVKIPQDFGGVISQVNSYLFSLCIRVMVADVRMGSVRESQR
jgi:hypothetical protein